MHHHDSLGCNGRQDSGLWPHRAEHHVFVVFYAEEANVVHQFHEEVGLDEIIDPRFAVPLYLLIYKQFLYEVRKPGDRKFPAQPVESAYYQLQLGVIVGIFISKILQPIIGEHPPRCEQVLDHYAFVELRLRGLDRIRTICQHVARTILTE